MIDTHCHLNLSPLLENCQQVWREANQAGIKLAVTIGTDRNSSRQAVEIAQRLSGIFAAVGIHPDVISSLTPAASELMSDWIKEIEELAHQEKVIAIGECGLDYVEFHSLSENEALRLKNQQKQLFGLHIQLAKKLELPLSIHCRNTKSAKDIPSPTLDAHKDLIDTLEHFSKEDGKVPKFVLHCMSGTMEYLQEGLRLGGYISFAGNVTYPNAGNLRSLLHETPMERLLLETDAPFLSPQSKRGTTNSPANIAETYTFVANELKITQKELETLTTTNSRNLFHFKI